MNTADKTDLLAEGLRTERLSMDRLTSDDIAAWVPFFTFDDSSSRYLGLESRDPEVMAQQWIEKQMARYEDKNGLLALRSLEDGRLIGMAGLLLQELDGEQIVEIGYHILGEFRNKGYASEAARSLRRHAFDTELALEVYSIIHEDNDLSCKVAHRNGMLLDRETTYKGLKVKVYKAEKYLTKVSFGEYLGMAFVAFLILIFLGWLVQTLFF